MGEVLKGDARSAQLGNAVSDAIHAALVAGLNLDVAASIVVCVATDYGVGEYGQDFARGLAQVAVERAARPTPERPA